MSRTPAWRTALSLFTAIPAGTGGELDEGDAARAVLWLPPIGLLLAIPGAAVIVGIGTTGDTAPRRLLGAALALALLGLLTGGLHLDGLADTADGLGSRRPAAAALDIMRKSDVGPMGVASLVLVLLIQVATLSAIPSANAAALSLILSQVTARASVVLATASPSARPGGFGALVAGSSTRTSRALTVTVLAIAVAAIGFALGGWHLAAQGIAATAIGLLAGVGMRLLAVRRLGGTTGDVFGAVLEITATATLLTCALAA